MAALLGLALLAPPIAHADFSDDYVAGLAALDHGEYAQAVQLLKKAIEAQPMPVSRVMVEGIAQPYLPHHFLGMAQFKLGNCAAAKTEWNDPMNLRMLGRLHQLRAQEEQLQGQCKPAVATTSEKSTNPQSAQAAQAPAPPPVVPAPAAPPSKPAAPPAVAGPPAALVRAFDDYLAGRYASAAKLDADGFSGARARFQGFVLRSAARFALSRLGDTTQLEAARRDARAAQALDKSQPDERIFSPAFRAFYAAAR